MIKFLKTNRNSIIISALVGTLIFYSQPLLIYFGNKVVSLLISVNESFARYIYKLAAQNDPNLLISNVSSIALLFLVFMGLDRMAEPWSRLRDVQTELSKAESRLNRESKCNNPNNHDIEQMLQRIRVGISKMKKLSFIVTVMYAFLMIYFVINLTISSTVNTMNVSFQNHLVALSPYVGDDEIKQLKFKWVYMRSAHDYKEIANKVNDMMSKHNLNSLMND